MGDAAAGPFYKNKKFIAGSSLVLLLLLVLAFFRALSGQATGTINNSANNYVASAVATPMPVAVSGIHISFKYLDSFRVVPLDKPSGTQLEKFQYVTKKSPFWTLAIDVSSLPSGSLADDGSYLMRTKNSTRYKHELWYINGASVDVFTDQLEPYSKAAFIAHNNKVVSLALSGSGDETKMQQIQQDVVKSLEWKD